MSYFPRTERKRQGVHCFIFTHSQKYFPPHMITMTMLIFSSDIVGRLHMDLVWWNIQQWLLTLVNNTCAFVHTLHPYAYNTLHMKPYSFPLPLSTTQPLSIFSPSVSLSHTHSHTKSNSRASTFISFSFVPGELSFACTIIRLTCSCSPFPCLHTQLIDYCLQTCSSSLSAPPLSLTCTLLSLSSPVPRIPLHLPQGILASSHYSSTAS